MIAEPLELYSSISLLMCSTLTKVHALRQNSFCQRIKNYGSNLDARTKVHSPPQIYATRTCKEKKEGRSKIEEEWKDRKEEKMPKSYK